MRAVILAVLVMLAAPATAQPGQKAPGAGSWHGTGFQVGPGGVQSSWKIEMTIGARNATITYPSLGCRSELELAVRTGARTEYVETITAGDCITKGRITAIQENGRLFWFWTKPDIGADASAVLYPDDQLS